MDWSAPTLWWLAAGALVAAELATGTFYLLMLALGLAAAAIASHLGLALTGQIVAAALVGGGATAAWHWHRFRQPTSAPARENRDVNLDIGERINVAEWAADRTARVPYRGQRCEPWMFQEVYKKIAALRDEDEEVVREQLVKNARQFYQLG